MRGDFKNSGGTWLEGFKGAGRGLNDSLGSQLSGTLWCEVYRFMYGVHCTITRSTLQSYKKYQQFTKHYKKRSRGLVER